MTEYKGYKIEKLSQRGIYQITDPTQKLIAIFPLLRDCKKLIDKKVGA